MSSTQEKLYKELDDEVHARTDAVSYGFIMGIVDDLIDSAKREGAIEIRNLYGSPKCEALHHPKKYQHTAFEDCPVEKEINALTEQSEESV